MLRLLKFALIALALAAPARATPPALFDWFAYQGSNPAEAGLEVGPDQYRNPILTGFYPDPSVLRVGEYFYLVTSTFAYFPGLPVFRSKDLVNWTQIGNAIDRPDQLDFKQLGLSRGVFAPTIHHRDGLFYILNTCVDCGGNFVLTATDPAGPWSDPAWLPDLEGGIDPSLFFDDDGSAWVVNNGPPVGEPLYEGHRAIWIQQFDRKTLKTFGPRKLLVNGGVDISTKPIWIEGPNILKKDGYYYLTCAEGGTAEGHSQVVLRSRVVTGPYAPYEGNPILTQRDLPRDRTFPITSAGHAQLVTTPDGKWWATFLAVQPYEGDFYNTGRETFLLPVEWRDGWPVILDRGKPIPRVLARPDLPKNEAPVPMSGPFTARDEFETEKLPPYWMMMRNPRENWYRLEGGSLALDPRPMGLGDKANPSFIARRQQHRDASAETELRFAPEAEGDRAGMVALQNDDHWYFLSVGLQDGGYGVTLTRRAGPGDPAEGHVIASVPLGVPAGAPVRLRIATRGDTYDFFYATNGGWRPLLEGADGRILSTKTAGGFVGAVFGLHARSEDR